MKIKVNSQVVSLYPPSSLSLSSLSLYFAPPVQKIIEIIEITGEPRYKELYSIYNMRRKLALYSIVRRKLTLGKTENQIA